MMIVYAVSTADGSDAVRMLCNRRGSINNEIRLSHQIRIYRDYLRSFSPCYIECRAV